MIPNSKINSRKQALLYCLASPAPKQSKIVYFLQTIKYSAELWRTHQYTRKTD